MKAKPGGAEWALGTLLLALGCEPGSADEPPQWLVSRKEVLCDTLDHPHLPHPWSHSPCSQELFEGPPTWGPSAETPRSQLHLCINRLPHSEHADAPTHAPCPAAAPGGPGGSRMQGPLSQRPKQHMLQVCGYDRSSCLTACLLGPGPPPTLA